jgi:hypothetical protein
VINFVKFSFALFTPPLGDFQGPVATPKRRRMASVLDAVMETTKALTPAPIKKVAEVAKV